MKDIQIGIIGGTGGMGAWFARFLRQAGYRVHVSGRRSGMSGGEMAAVCSVVIVSVPIGVTGQVIRNVGPFMKKESLLMDLTSLKEEPVKAMLASSRSAVIGLHPLFGPSVPSMKEQNIILCPARTLRWHSWLRDLLEKGGARVTEATPARHDEMMALVQGLTHLNTIVMGLILDETGTDRTELEAFSTPVFRTKSALIETIFGNNPGLYAEIITGSPHMEQIAALYEKYLGEMTRLIGKKDPGGIVGLITGKKQHCG